MGSGNGDVAQAMRALEASIEPLKRGEDQAIDAINSVSSCSNSVVVILDRMVGDIMALAQFMDFLDKGRDRLHQASGQVDTARTKINEGDADLAAMYDDELDAAADHLRKVADSFREGSEAGWEGLKKLKTATKAYTSQSKQLGLSAPTMQETLQRTFTKVTHDIESKIRELDQVLRT